MSGPAAEAARNSAAEAAKDAAEDGAGDATGNAADAAARAALEIGKGALAEAVRDAAADAARDAAVEAAENQAAVPAGPPGPAATQAGAPASGPPPTAEAVIHADGIGISFGNRTIFKDVSFEVRRGEIFVILGGSGCGKSTLMKILIGLLPPTAGTALVLGQELAKLTGKPRRTALSHIGVMWQQGALLGSLNLMQNVALPMEQHTKLPPEARDALARAKLGLVGLGDAATRLPAEISGGMLKRAGIARAMALDPEILFLDEPSAGLDPITSAGLDDLITTLARDTGTTFVVVTHELQSILAIGDRCIMLDKAAQGMIATGAPKDLRDNSDNPVVRAFFRREVLKP